MRWPICHVLLAATLTLALAACAPSTTIDPQAPYRGPTYTGPISGVAVVMSTPGSRYRDLANSAYTYAVSAVARHPFARPRYDMIERSEIDRILEEQGISQSGFVDRSTAPQLGQLLGAQYILIVDLVSADVRNTGVRGIDLGGVRLGGGVATVEVTIASRMIDVTTGRVLGTGMGTVSGTTMTGLSIDNTAIGSPASVEIAVDLFPEAVMRSLNDLFRLL